MVRKMSRAVSVFFVFSYICTSVGMGACTQETGSRVYSQMVTLRGKSLDIGRPASPLALPDRYCGIIEQAVFDTTNTHKDQPLHVNFGSSLLPVLQNISDQPTTDNTQAKLLRIAWKNRLAQLMTNLTKTRTITGLSVLGVTPEDRDILSPMIEVLVRSDQLEKLSINYLTH
jgi:hypothetical protein